MFKARKANISVMKFIFILIIVVIILGSTAFLLLQYQKVSTDDRKLKTQLIINRLLDGKCFSDEYATFEEEKFTQENFDECIKGLYEDTQVRIVLNGVDYYSKNDEEKFKSLVNLCVQKSSLLCTEMKYPITFIDTQKAHTIKVFTVQIITT